MRELTKEEINFFKQIRENHKPFKARGDYFEYEYRILGKRNRIKRSRLNFMIHYGVFLERWEMIHHKDEDKENDNIKNLEVIDTKNFNHHTSMHFSGKRGSKTGNHSSKTRPEVIKRAKEIAMEMIKINYSEISRRLLKEGIKINSYTLKNLM